MDKEICESIEHKLKEKVTKEHYIDFIGEVTKYSFLLSEEEVISNRYIIPIVQNFIKKIEIEDLLKCNYRDFIAIGYLIYFVKRFHHHLQFDFNEKEIINLYLNVISSNYVNQEFNGNMLTDLYILSDLLDFKLSFLPEDNFLKNSNIGLWDWDYLTFKGFIDQVILDNSNMNEITSWKVLTLLYKHNFYDLIVLLLTQISFHEFTNSFIKKIILNIRSASIQIIGLNYYHRMIGD
ncbi:MAG TPA: hypothetical protein VK121_09090 [Pseudogracilibacillus sp.]|nr:hypothetical protein [Pseudogracilibacillus sp.]